MVKYNNTWVTPFGIKDKIIKCAYVRLCFRFCRLLGVFYMVHVAQLAHQDRVQHVPVVLDRIHQHVAAQIEKNFAGDEFCF